MYNDNDKYSNNDFNLSDLEEDEKYKSPLKSILIKLFSVVVLIAFLSLSFSQLFPLITSENFSFLTESNKLNDNPVVESIKPAVVYLNVKNSKGTMITSGQGTGFNICSDGLIVTNHHLLENAVSATIEFSDGKSFTSNNFKKIPDIDLAFIFIEGENLPKASLQNTLASTNETVFIIGNPLGFPNIAVQGKIGNHYRSDNEDFYLFEIDSDIRKGNSGSPVVNKNGKVVGIVFALTQIQIEDDIESRALAISASNLDYYIPEHE
ncbi:hypothetical protein SYNTR_0556 [Candidatus Syntrophocurvum alkaliphilum]|uniref:Serine protease n=1 Tax=Candidatus Syntrophocurvum alkaliphilum TaxID=2293317 RepID=A0A6I6DHS9_9FIRM|nr:serine protease [Candidatus Syntrophocurvum alkaliphilum]QGT99149.1 hypothetical protein SYNTR_0556 [Candidatus Syntrophocurvum alkaliphilum]